jgi:CheY-like chemotaxis protein
MPNEKKNVLIVEDSAIFALGWQWQLKKLNIGSLHAVTIEEARTFFQTHSFDLIVMDCCVPGHRPNTIPLVQHMRLTFHGPILANSNHEPYRLALVQAGASHHSDKESVAPRVCEILGVAWTA